MSDQYDFIIPKEIAERGKDAIKTVEDVVGSGPYELLNWEAGKGLTKGWLCAIPLHHHTCGVAVPLPIRTCVRTGRI